MIAVVLRPLGDMLATHGAAWERLWLDHPEATLFMGPGFARAWAATLAGRATPLAAVATEGDAIVGAMALVVSRARRGPSFLPRIDMDPAERVFAGPGRRPFPVRQLSPVVSWRAAAIRPSLLTAAGREAEVARAVAAALAEWRGVDQIALPVAADGAGPWLAGLRDGGLRPWLVDLGREVLTCEALAPMDALMAARSGNARRNLKRARAAAAEAGLSFRMVEGAAAVRAALPELAAVAAASWKAESAPDRVAVPHAGDQAAFVAALLDAPGAGVPALLLGEAGGETHLAQLVIRHGPTLTGLLTFRRDTLAEASPGLLGVGALCDWAAAAGARRFDLNATQPWLRNVADRRQGLAMVLAFRPTPRGRLYGAIRALRARRP